MKKFVAFLMAFVIGCGLWHSAFGMKAIAAEEGAMDISSLLGEVKEKLSEAVSELDTETVKGIFGFVGEKVKDGSLKTEEGLSDALKEGKEKFGVTISKEDAKQVVAAMEKLESMGFSGEYVLQKTEGLYDEYGAEFVEHADEVIAGAVQNAVSNAAKGFFNNLVGSVKSFFRNLVSA